MKILKLNRSDLEKHIDVFIQILKNEENEYWGKEHFLMELKSKWNFSLFVEDNHKIIGYLIASKKKKSIHIHKFMVRKEFRSKGIGLKLLKKLEDLCWMNSESLVTLKVDKNNKFAIKFYLKNGFIVDENYDNKSLLMYKYLEF